MTATFFMPAMPAMGMAAERAAGRTRRQRQRALTRARCNCESGGTWQVT